MDELARKRRHPSAVPEPGTRPEDDLAQRERVARADDHVAELRDAGAETDDEKAAGRDSDAAERDALAEALPHDAPMQEVRHRARQDREEAASDRTSAGSDRSRAQGDRSDSQHGRVRASNDRSAAAQAMTQLRQLMDEAEARTKDMLVIAEAQGRLMNQQGLSAPLALINVAVRAIHDETPLGEAARKMLKAQHPAD